MEISTVGKAVGKAWDKRWALQKVLGLRVQVLLEVAFLLNLFFSALIQFWQIWQNDLFTENLEWLQDHLS